MEKAQTYIAKEKQKKTHEESLIYYKEELSSLERQRKRITSIIEEFERELVEAKNAISLRETLLDKDVLGHRLFAKVKNIRPVSSNLSISILTEAFEDLSLKVDGFLSERNVVERELRIAKSQLDDAIDKIESLEYEHPGITAAEPFPSNGTEQIKTLTLQAREFA